MEESSNQDGDIELVSSNDKLESQGHSIPKHCVTSTKKLSLATFTIDMTNMLIDMDESCARW